jgi:hypothetical protein
LDHYAKVLQDKGYLYGRHIAPHDIEVKELGSGRTRREQAGDLGINFEVAPRQSIQDGINAVRTLLPTAYFDKTRCGQLVEALMLYRTEYDEKNKVFRANPLHDWTSHYADSVRYLATARMSHHGGSNWDLPINAQRGRDAWR